MAEICRLAQVPVPTHRMQRMRSIRTRTFTATHAEPTTVSPSPPRITLTAEQTRRLLIVAHLEEENDPMETFDALLDADTRLRRHGLTIQNRRVIADFLDAATRRGWQVEGPSGLVVSLSLFRSLRFEQLTPATIQDVLKLIALLRIKKWTVETFVEYVTRHANEMELYTRYARGVISFEEFARGMRAYVA